ncbi:MAG: hypothetical protein R3F31_25850 [Verrucomicrobiales bacterium]
MPSELEWFYGMNDLDPADGAADLDGDGFSNAEAFQQGWVLDAALVSPVPDLDGDRLNDITEAHWAQVHPAASILAILSIPWLTTTRTGS